MDEKDKRIAELEAEIRVLRQRLEQLERRLGLNSKTSSKPPSSDGLRKPSPKSLRTSTKIFGGQKGHKGSTLRQVPHPDQTINIKVNSCSVCHQSLESHACETIVKRQVFKVEIKHHVVEYQAEVKICSCGKRNVADFPEQVRGQTQYGNCVKALGIYFMNHFVPKERRSRIMNDLFKIPVSDTALMNNWLHIF